MSRYFSWGEGGRGDVTLVEGEKRVKGGGRAPLPSASWAKNTIMTECTVRKKVAKSGICTLWSVVTTIVIKN